MKVYQFDLTGILQDLDLMTDSVQVDLGDVKKKL